MSYKNIIFPCFFILTKKRKSYIIIQKRSNPLGKKNMSDIPKVLPENAALGAVSSNRLPKYERLRLALLNDISVMPEDQMFLPYEKELTKRFRVCRSTVSHALERLREEGYITTSKKSGSRIVRRPGISTAGKTPAGSISKNIAVLFANTRMEPIRNLDFRWELSDEIEHVFSDAGHQTFVYNLRENDWNTWKEPEKLLDSLREREIRFLIFFPTLDKKFNLRKHLDTLLRSGIKIVFLLQSSYDFRLLEDHLRPGIDFLLLNELYSFRKALEDFFSDSHQIFYIANAANRTWAEARMNLCRTFCRERKIPFHFLESSYLWLNDSMTQRNVLNINDECIKRFRKTVAGKGKIVCFCSNDYTAFSFITKLKEHEIDPTCYEIVGFDNNTEFRSLHFSSFTRAPLPQAQALLRLYQDFIRDPENILHRGTGITTYARFIKRHQ